MGQVFKSVSDAFNACFSDIQSRITHNQAIYGTANRFQTLYTEEGFGVRPILSGKIIEESNAEEVLTLKYGSHEGHTYNIMKNINLQNFSNATKDDLYLFVIMAPPKTLSNAVIKNKVYHRLSQIYLEELTNCGENKEQIQQQQQEDQKRFDFIYTSISTAVKGSGNKIYYAPNHLPDESMET